MTSVAEAKTNKEKIIAALKSVILSRYKKQHNLKNACSYAGVWLKDRMKHVAPQEKAMWRSAAATVALEYTPDLRHQLMQHIV